VELDLIIGGISNALTDLKFLMALVIASKAVNHLDGLGEQKAALIRKSAHILIEYIH